MCVTNTKQVLAALHPFLNERIHPQQNGKREKGPTQERRKAIPPELGNYPIHGKAGKHASKWRHQTVHANNDAGIACVSILHRDQLAE